jgi:outer membrane immunogenic protein
MIGNGLSEVAWGFLMRRLLVAGFIAVATQGTAFAADLPILRGALREPAPACCRAVWQGFYVGGQAGYAGSNAELQEFSFTGWPAVVGATHRAPAFGAFGGYNAQYENVVLGFEGSFMHGTLTNSDSNETRTTNINAGPIAGLTSVVTRRTDASIASKDWGSVRVRGGYVMGNFLPYFFAGFGMGRADTVRTATVRGVYTGTLTENQILDPDRTSTVGVTTKNQFVHGFSAGAGMDWMLFGGLFARAEYEYLQFTSTVNTSIHSIRGGIGYKF